MKQLSIQFGSMEVSITVNGNPNKNDAVSSRVNKDVFQNFISSDAIGHATLPQQKDTKGKFPYEKIMYHLKNYFRGLKNGNRE